MQTPYTSLPSSPFHFTSLPRPPSPPPPPPPQIGKEVKRFAKTAGLTCVCVYGGSGVANQISELKRGTEVVICTPGRMIDILGERGDRQAGRAVE